MCLVVTSLGQKITGEYMAFERAEIRLVPILASYQICQAQCYLNRYADLKNVFGSDIVRAKDHWRIYGLREGRDPTCAYPCELSDCQVQCYLNR